MDFFQLEFGINSILGAVRTSIQLAPSEVQESNNQLQKLFDEEITRPGSHHRELWFYSRDKSSRMSINYLELNRFTMKNRYPLPQINDLCNQPQRLIC